MTTFDFGDGKGPVPAHQHSNGGGWVADTAIVAATAYVGSSARVYGNAWVSGDARVYGAAMVYGKAQVYGNAWVSGDARVSDDAQVYGNAWVSGDARVSDDARVCGNARVCDAPTENDDDVNVTEEGCSENTDILIKMVTNEYIYYFQPSNAFVGSATRMMANANIVISRKTNKLVKCRYALEDLIDERFNLK